MNTQKLDLLNSLLLESANVARMNGNGVAVLSKALQAASERKARMVTFYRNGEVFTNGLKVSILPGKDFKSLRHLCEYLTDKTQILRGVRYIFTLSGRQIRSLNELEHNEAYVISGTNQFQYLPYGNQERVVAKTVNSTALKPLSPKLKAKFYNKSTANFAPKEGRILTVINGKEPSIVTRVLLNLRNTKSFEGIVKDLGQAVRLKNARRMFTPDGLQVRSISQLNRELSGINTFFIDTSDGHTDRSRVKSHSCDRINLSTSTNDANGDYLRQNVVLRTDSAPDYLNEEPYFTDVNPSRDEDSISSHESVSLNDLLADVHTASSSKSKNVETQTSPDFTRATRRQLKKQRKLERKQKAEEKRKRNVQFETKTNNKVKNVKKQVANKSNNTSTQVEDKIVFETPPPVVNNAVGFVKPSVNSDPHVGQKSDVKSEPLVIEKPLVSNEHPVFEKPQTISKPNIVDKPKSTNKPPLTEKPPVKNVPPDASKSENNKPEIVEKSSIVNESPVSNSAIIISKPRVSNPSPVIPSKPQDNKNAADNTSLSSSFNYQEKTPQTNDAIVSKSDGALNQIKKEKKPVVKQTLKPKKQNPKIVPNVVTKTNVQFIAKNGDIKVDSVNTETPKVDSVFAQRATSRERMSTTCDETNSTPIPNQSLEKVRSGKFLDNNLREGTNIPDRNFRLNWVFGYKGNVLQNNLFALSNGEIVYHTGAVVVLWNPNLKTQRHYAEHSHDIQSLALSSHENVAVTAQNADATRGPFNIQINVWCIDTLKTECVLCSPDLGKTIVGVTFSNKGFLLIVSFSKKLRIFLWNWKRQEMIVETSESLPRNETLFGVAFHSIDSLCVTFGTNHLRLWQFERNRFGNKSVATMDSKTKTTINCVQFLSEDTMLSGDANGNITVWSPLHDNKGRLQFDPRHLKGHNKAVTALLVLSDNYLVTGDAGGTLKSWNFRNFDFKPLKTFILPDKSGEIGSLAVNYPENIKDVIVYIGTSRNLIFSVSLFHDRTVSILFEGHSPGLRNIGTHVSEPVIYSSSLDLKICKWKDKSLIWSNAVTEQCVSLAIHPSSLIIALGTVKGVIVMVNSQTGETISNLAVADVPIGCLQFSMKGDMLAAGTQNGIIYILPVTDNGFSYEKVSVLRGLNPILTLQWSTDGQYILSSVNDNNFQELILWDLPNFRYLRGASTVINNINWYDATCTGGDDVKGIWENPNVNQITYLACHCSYDYKYLVSGDDEGLIRLFKYPCSDAAAAFYEGYQGSSGVIEARFLADNNHFVTANYEGSIFLWELF